MSDPELEGAMRLGDKNPLATREAHDLGDDIIFGSNGDDSIVGGEGRDYLFGLNGIDHVTGDGGATGERNATIDGLQRLR